jgi:hypothetical protein
MLKSYLKQDNVAPHPNAKLLLHIMLPPHFNVKFPLLSLLQFISDLKVLLRPRVEI